MIHVRDLTVHYADQIALQDVSFDVRLGECLVVTGPSGCGKSTLVRVLTGLIPQVIPAEISGRVEVAGLDVTHCLTAETAQHVGVVFQNPRAHLFHLRVADEVAFGPYNLELPPEEVKARVEWALEAVGLSDLSEQNPACLSGGQIQRLAIASALAMRPQVLVLDEPTASLDAPGTTSVINALVQLRAEYGLTIVLIEHRLAEVRRLADRVMVLDEGRVVAAGAFETVLGDYDLLRRYGLRRPTEEPLMPWADLLMPNGKPPAGVQPLLEFQNLSAGYNGHAAIHDVNLRFYPGEFAALVGDNGAGKSTLALAAAGLIRPMSGRLLFNNGARPRPGQDIALLFQNPADQLFTDSVDEEIAFGPRNYRCFELAWHEQALASADLLGLRERRPFSLSVGQQQRTALASCLALRPRLVILDEPTLGQDWRHLQQLMDFLVWLNRQGTAILLITHDYKLVYRYAQRVILMDAGRISLDGHINLDAQKNMPTATHAEVNYVGP
ncbi:MAG: ABC transporter ATP-binding protein [Chloroflexi bacterium]|nr:ABC transporter ATP-binding protein [Chloroflexota bacterium]